ncbi:MAG TPA: CoA-binding protein [Thermoanaerobaculia bacterium]|nr:CoA-binding protein [Thermoanaerobaculia bacterium]
MRSIAILGASPQRSKFGNKAVRAYLAGGWQVLPVNPAGAAIEGQPSFKSLADLPVTPDRLSVYLPPPVTLALLPAMLASGASQVFFNPGSADDAVHRRARELGLPFVDACSIVDIGFSPSQFP